LKYKKYYRKTSLKQEGVGSFFLDQIAKKEPKSFLEVGVFHGVTARNVCELLYKIHGKDFQYVGLDLFEENDENKDEVIPNTKFSNPLKTLFFKYIKRLNPYSLNGVKDLLKKFKDNVHLIKGNSNKILTKIDMSKIDYVFLDGGHAYETVKKDLEACKEVVDTNGTVLCDDYNLGAQAPEVKMAIDEFVKKNNLKCEILCNGRFAKIEKN
jgi:predicted O-methyltransferase YrrM